jgi:hypothetical protein
MRIRQRVGQMTRIDTEIFQSKDGAIRINFGNETLRIPESLANNITSYIDDFDSNLYNKYYKINGKSSNKSS